MGDNQILTGVLINEETTISWTEVRQQYNVSEEILVEMMEYGLFNVDITITKPIDQKTMKRILSACRLQQDLALNVPGVVLVLELLDELEEVRNELSILQRHVEK